MHTRALVALPLVVALVTPTAAMVWGGGSDKTDCYVAWRVTTDALGASRGKSAVDCQDGDPACDLDGAQDGTCTFGVSICAFQRGPTGCEPQPIATIIPSRRAQALGIQAPPTPASESVCGTAAILPIPLRTTRKGQRASRPLKLKMKALGTVKSVKDVDTLTLRCVPNRGVGQCPANPDGGPRAVTLRVAREGTDLDNGWNGQSHNFPVVFGATLTVCLTGCNADTNPLCLIDTASTDSVNLPTFGAPLPLFSAGVPVCVVNRFASPKVTDGTGDLRTGDLASVVHLLSDVYITPTNALCPRCSGKEIGKTGTCDSGARQGQACRTDGVITVAEAPGDKSFTLSSDCPPGGTPAGTLTVTLPATTGASTLTGPRPCAGQPFDDDCSRPGGVGGTCSATCTACVGTTGAGDCIAPNGGIQQLCCSGDTTRACFPTAGGGQIVRTGRPGLPVPPWPDPAYPKTASAVLAATFCEGSSGSTLVNAVAGLPGPGAVILPVDTEWVK